ncbi:MAG: FAD:protein FMN transferase [Lachnospiraceae bacterium]
MNRKFQNQNQQKQHIFTVAFCFLIMLLCAGCQRNEEPTTIQGFYFDTFISITFYEPVSDEIKTGCLDLCSYYENLLSATKEGSDIYRINHSNGNPCTVNDETMELLQIAYEYASITNGKCDFTIRPVSSLWDFTNPQNTELPEQAMLENALQHVNYENVVLDGNTVTLADPDMQLDLGFIAKGFIADKISSYLQSRQTENCLINLGGNLLLMGSHKNGQPYRIGIEKPFDTTAPIVTMQLTDTSVVTSGVYQRYFRNNENLYHHLLDPSTGYPVNNGLFSVTIIGPSSTHCDALSTCCFLLGLDNGLALINQSEGYEALFITEDYDIITSANFPAYE